jgi:hypothetical protein
LSKILFGRTVQAARDGTTPPAISVVASPARVGEVGEYLTRPEEPIFQACMRRFRPITMPTTAALLGALPLAIGFGTGAELRRPLGIAIVDGLIFSQALMLYTTPVGTCTSIASRVEANDDCTAGLPAPALGVGDDRRAGLSSPASGRCPKTAPTTEYAIRSIHRHIDGASVFRVCSRSALQASIGAGCLVANLENAPMARSLGSSVARWLAAGVSRALVLLTRIGVRKERRRSRNW